MLILTRRVGESIFIGDNIKIQVVQVQRGNVRISIDAPKEVLILRSELKDKVSNLDDESNYPIK